MSALTLTPSIVLGKFHPLIKTLSFPRVFFCCLCEGCHIYGIKVVGLYSNWVQWKVIHETPCIYNCFCSLINEGCTCCSCVNLRISAPSSHISMFSGSLCSFLSFLEFLAWLWFRLYLLWSLYQTTLFGERGQVHPSEVCSTDSTNLWCVLILSKPNKNQSIFWSAFQ